MYPFSFVLVNTSKGKFQALLFEAQKEVMKMSGYEFCEGYWWIFPLVMIFLCFFFMRRSGARGWCGFSEYDSPKDSAMDILDKRYAQGDIDQVEYEEKRRTLDKER
ncbi:MAG: SHOCT domain-containing protein [Desulfofustis sp.]